MWTSPPLAFLLLLITATCFCSQVEPIPAPNIQHFLESLFGGGENNSSTFPGGGALVLPPALSVDIVNLLRWVIHEEVAKVSYVEAMYFCRAYGMELVSIETQEENDLIMKHIDDTGNNDKLYFLSAHKMGRSTFLWLNGANLIYENWQPGEPNNHATYHCVVLLKKKWYDYPCSPYAPNDWYQHFICEEPED